MPEATVQQLSMEAFAPYGYYGNMINPTTCVIGEKPIEFFRDMVQLNLGNATSASFSVCRVEPRESVVDVSEFHTVTGEGILPLDEDILIHVAPATPSKECPVNDVALFRIPKGTMVVLKPGVWHHAPYTASDRPANVLIVLPERTYANDCEVVELSESEKVRFKG